MAARSEHPARVQLLGRFAVEVEESPIPATQWRKRRPIEALTAVALAPGQVLHREELIDRLWPDKPLDAGANNLHRALHDLRRITGTPLVVMERGSVRLAERVFVDVVAFEHASASSDASSLARAAELYTGPLLPDDPYSDALASRREGLRQRFIDVSLRLAKLYHEASELDACIDTLRRALAEDGTLEPAHQLLMRALAEMGRPSDALRQFAECTAAPREQLGTAPSRSSTELRSAIERGELEPRPAPQQPEPSGPSRAAAPPLASHGELPRREAARPLHGREEVLATVEAWVAGGRGVLLLLGEGGLGKTRIARACVELATRQGAAALVGLGLDEECGVPYAPFASAWASHRRATNGSRWCRGFPPRETSPPRESDRDSRPGGRPRQ